MQIKIGDKLVEGEMRDGVIYIKAQAEEIKREDGTQDVVVRVPCLQIQGGNNGKRDL